MWVIADSSHVKLMHSDRLLFNYSSFSDGQIGIQMVETDMSAIIEQEKITQ